MPRTQDTATHADSNNGLVLMARDKTGANTASVWGTQVFVPAPIIRRKTLGRRTEIWREPDSGNFTAKNNGTCPLKLQAPGTATPWRETGGGNSHLYFCRRPRSRSSGVCCWTERNAERLRGGTLLVIRVGDRSTLGLVRPRPDFNVTREKSVPRINWCSGRNGYVVKSTVTDRYVQMVKDARFRAEVAEQIGLELSSRLTRPKLFQVFILSGK
jgi:hypothetical protein